MPPPKPERELPDDPLDVRVAKRVRWQAYWCGRLGSPLYADLLSRVADDIDAGGPFRALMTDPAIDPLAPNLPPLRLMGSVNRLVLTGLAPEMSWEALASLARDRPDEIREHINRPVQTNEVGRCGPLHAGFLWVARSFGLPLRMLEVGASAGLNMRFDRYRYETGRGNWGPADSPVRLSGFWKDGDPPYDSVALEIADRRGCDLSPVDPTTDEGRVTLLSYVWPDQHQRVTNLRGALDVARDVPATVDRAEATEWVSRELASLPSGVVSVVFHSIVMQYLSEEERGEFAAAVASAGESRATSRAPLSWLRAEYGGDECELRVTTWPGGEEKLLATHGFHGLNVVWLA
ncbi:MAG: DUF2332 domain-containing protein [Thermoleophilaceae bacterium]